MSIVKVIIDPLISQMKFRPRKVILDIAETLQ